MLPISTGEMRRRSPLHHWSRADNARFAAYILAHATSEALEGHKSAIGYGGSPNIAMHEAFVREASLALELIVKAVIAIRIEGRSGPATLVRVRTTHDVLSLWESDAGLPVQPEEDRTTLALAASFLRWAGRYAAPKDDAVYEEERRRSDMIAPPPPTGNLRIVRGRSISWDQFDRLYVVAAGSFWRLYEARWGRPTGADVDPRLQS